MMSCSIARAASLCGALLGAAMAASCDGHTSPGGHEYPGHNNVVLLSSSATITSNPITLTVKQPVPVQGDDRICLVLLDNVEYDNRKRVDELYEQALGGAILRAAVYGKDGRVIEFDQNNQGWTKQGLVASGEELSVCLSYARGALPASFSAVRIAISSDKPVRVIGVYWMSMAKL